MKLLTVGRSPQSNIYIDSQFVSSYHADILILDNGEILIVDKNSTNGTKVNGNTIAAGVEVPVRRGDSVIFADTQLDWNKVPSIKLDPNAKQIIGIGSHPKNKIHIPNDRVSRFHATIKQTNKGQWLICDHSANGTTLNGTRLSKDMWVKLKKGDQIKCAGISVDNPVTSKSGAKAAIISCAAVLAACAIACVVILCTGSMSDKRIYKKHASSTVFVVCDYHFKISAGSLDFESLFGGIEFVFNDLGEPVLYDGENSHTVTGTGFFISPDGLIATNLHVARPWFTDNDIIQPVADYFRTELNELADAPAYKYLSTYISQLKVEGVVDQISIVPTGMYFEQDNAISCGEIVASSNKDIDLAIIKTRLGSGTLPEGSTYVDINQIPDDKTYVQGTHTYTFGYSTGIALQDVQNKLLEVISSPGSIMNTNSEYSFMINTDATYGASGSPVFNDHAQLIGVMSRSNSKGYTSAVRAKYIKALLDEKEIKY